MESGDDTSVQKSDKCPLKNVSHFFGAEVATLTLFGPIRSGGMLGGDVTSPKGEMIPPLCLVLLFGRRR